MLISAYHISLGIIPTSVHRLPTKNLLPGLFYLLMYSIIANIIPCCNLDRLVLE